VGGVSNPQTHKLMNPRAVNTEFLLENSNLLGFPMYLQVGYVPINRLSGLITLFDSDYGLRRRQED
jgi:hypothetical protein